MTLLSLSAIGLGLVEDEFRHSPLGQVLTIVQQPEEFREEPAGFYWSFSAASMMFQHNDLWKEYDSFTGVNHDGESLGEKIADVDWSTYRENYGVCDNVEQILAKYPELNRLGREFVVALTIQKKSEQCDAGGWRWHKWGEYIGDLEPQEEYLYDEPEIEQAICFHIYEKVNK